jgi:curved DNA-binding protein CbpA
LQTPDLNADNLYERLGLNADAPVEEIKRAYHRLLRIYPPERSPEQFKRIREAYETLKDAGSRRGYDTQREPKVGHWIELGIAAIGENRYTDAERYFKQVLIQVPTLAFARNYLGLSFLYQGKGVEAIAQYQRLLRTEPVTASFCGNLGHAYRIAGQLGDAERAFRRAIEFGDEDKANYYLALADVYLAQNRIESAKAILEKGIRADNNVDFEDLPLFTKLLECELRERDFAGVNDVVDRIQGIVQDDEQGRYAAWKLGMLAQRLIEVDAFPYAVVLSLAARRLMPDDADYHALVAVSERLDAKDLLGASKVVQTHPSFLEGAWLSQLGPIVQKYCVENRILAEMKPITSAPSLRTINTVGTALYGRRDYDEATSSYVATLYFVIAFIPLLPLANYRVVDGNPGWHFLGKVPFSHPQKVHLWAVLAGLSLWVLVSVLTAKSSVNQTASTFSAAPPAADSPAATDTTPDPLGLFTPSTVYNGTVTNAGFKDSPASFRVAFDSAADTTTGYATIGRPLGGSGRFWAIVKHDSVYLISASLTGDTIVWGARRAGLRLAGAYALVGGPMIGQHGTWDVHRDSGVALPRH